MISPQSMGTGEGEAGKTHVVSKGSQRRWESWEDACPAVTAHTYRAVEEDARCSGPTLGAPSSPQARTDLSSLGGCAAQGRWKCLRGPA